MRVRPGMEVWAHFPGNRVRATVVEVGVGEAKVVEIGASKAEWIPLSWVSSDGVPGQADDEDDAYDDDSDNRTSSEFDMLPGFGDGIQRDDD